MSTIVTRAGKGSPLTHTEVDSNFTNLNTDKLEKANNLSDLASASTARTNLGVAIGTDVQAYDANTAKLNAAQSWSAAQSFNAGVTLGDASGDALTINSSAVSIPNGLNFDSNTLVIDATNNRVGIGTNAPASALQIGSGSAGPIDPEIRIDSAGAGAKTPSLGFYVGASKYASITEHTVDGLLINQVVSLPIVVSTNNTERMRITSTGNVGIGTSSPNSLLDVAGTISIGGKSTLNTTGANTVNIGGIANNGLQTLNFYTNTTGNIATLRATLDSSGNLGFGVTPYGWGGSFKAIDFGDGGAVASNSATNARLVQNAYYNGTNWIYKTTNFASKYDLSGGNHQWFLAPSGTAGNAITFTQAMTLNASGQLSVGSTSAGTNAIVDITGTSNSDVVYPLQVYSNNRAASLGISYGGVSASGALTMYSSGTSYFAQLTTGGNFGVNTVPSGWTGGKALQIIDASLSSLNGQETYVTTNAYYATVGGWKYINTASAQRFYQGASGYAWYYAPSGTAGTTPTWTQQMTLDASGNLLVGGTSSYNKLTVTASSGDGIRIKATGTAALVMDGSSSNDILGLQNVPMTFQTNNTERMRIDSSGNVGIGTSSPTQKLQVNGSIYSTDANGWIGSTGRYNGTSNGAILWQNGSSNNLGIAEIAANKWSLGYFTNVPSAVAISSVITYDSSGNVGVGTTSPSYKLHVAGDVNFTGTLYKNGSVFSGGAKGGGTDAVFYENDTTVNTSYTITTGKNAMSAGAITIATGATVTVPTGSNWVIV